MVLDAINPQLPDTIGGSADLTGSNLTAVEGPEGLHQRRLCRPLCLLRHSRVRHGRRDERPGAARRRHPHGGTFLVFSDYARNAIRMSAIQQQRVIYVMSHDSIGQGEDGPTHQPIEHVMSLRMVPNLEVFRPCDAVETAECWQLALENTGGPTLLALTRQNVFQLRTDISENFSAKGGYTLVAARRAEGRDRRHRFGSRDRRRRGQGAGRAGHRRQRRLDAEPRRVSWRRMPPIRRPCCRQARCA